jgi:hypothetical protein
MPHRSSKIVTHDCNKFVQHLKASFALVLFLFSSLMGADVEVKSFRINVFPIPGKKFGGPHDCESIRKLSVNSCQISAIDTSSHTTHEDVETPSGRP